MAFLQRFRPFAEGVLGGVFEPNFPGGLQGGGSWEVQWKGDILDTFVFESFDLRGGRFWVGEIFYSNFGGGVVWRIFEFFLRGGDFAGHFFRVLVAMAVGSYWLNGSRSSKEHVPGVT